MRCTRRSWSWSSSGGQSVVATRARAPSHPERATRGSRESRSRNSQEAWRFLGVFRRGNDGFVVEFEVTARNFIRGDWGC